MFLRKLKYLLLTACMLPGIIAGAQYGNPLTFDAGVGIGGMNCQTDLGGPSGKGNSSYFNEINWNNTRFAASAFLNVNYRNLFGLRLEGTLGSVQAFDSVLKDASVFTAKLRYNRNLSFRSGIRSLNIIGEVHMLDLLRINTSFPEFSPYMAIGTGIFAFNPKTMLNGDWVYLQPLHTEGQGFDEYPNRKPYSLSGTNFIFGGGFAYSTLKMVYRLEFLHYNLSTDYLDDASTTYIDGSLFAKYMSPYRATVAQALYKRSHEPIPDGAARGSARNNDAYLTVMFKVGFNLFPDYGGYYRKMICW